MSAASVPIQINLLGRFEVQRGEATLAANGWSRSKAAALLQRLALEKRLLRDEALEFLWPESAPDAAANNLYRTLYSARQTLDETLGAGTSAAAFSFDDGVLRLAGDVRVDVHHFQELCRAETATWNRLQQALALYEGPLLPDNVYDDWTVPPRQGLQRLFRDTCLRLAREAATPEEIEAAVAHLQPLLAGDPADEVVHRQLMRLFALLGRRHDALRQYQACVEGLEAELGVPPMPETRTLQEEILSGKVHASASVPAPLRSAWPAPSFAGTGTQTPFTGREGELQALRALLEAAAGGEGKTVMIAGVTGVGKTRLAHELLRVASSQGMNVLLGAAYEYEEHLAYQPFAEAIDRYLEQAERPSRENPLTHYRPHDAGDLQQEKWALFSSTAAFLAQLSTNTPLILFLDDLHAADEASLQLFHYLARHTRSRPFLLLATYSTDMLLDPASPFGALLNALYREGLRQTVSLKPLADEAIAHIVRHVHAGAVNPGLVETIVEATEGNPYFAEEMCGALLGSDQLLQEDGAWRLKRGAMPEVPSDLRELLRERIMQSGPNIASVLEVAAVMGRTFTFEILRRVSILTEVDLIDALDTALQARFIEDANVGYRFRHGLLRNALYQAQSRPRRRRLHTLIATAVEDTLAAQQHRRGAPGLDVESLAHHYERSDRPERALPYFLQAGERAAALYAFEAAIDYYERALSLVDERAPDDWRRRWQLLEALGWWEKILANTPRAVAHFERALSLPPGAQWQPKPNDVARLHAGAAMALLTAGDTTAAEKHLNAALAQIDEQTHASEYADVLYNVAQLHWHRNEYDASFTAAQQSLKIAEQLDDSTAIARAFEMLALACHSLGKWQLGLDFEEKRSAIAGPELDVSDAFDVHL